MGYLIRGEDGMNAVERQALIYEYIKKHKEVSVNYIAEYFQISPVTVRRYLDALEQNGMIRREYGKAILADYSRVEKSYWLRSRENIESKRQIAKRALPYLLNASSAFFDGSSTALELLKLLPETKAITIYAANSAVFHYLENHEHVRLFVLGGYLNRADGLTLDSEITINIAKNIYVDSVFFSCSGFNGQSIFYDGTTGVGVKQILLKNSAHNYLLADHTKCNASSVIRIDSWDFIDTLVCDSKFDKKVELKLKDKGVEIIY